MGILSPPATGYSDPYSNNLCEQHHVYRRICPAGGHHPKGGPSLRTARAAARAQAARQVSRLPGRGSGVGRLYPRGPAAWLQARGAGSPLAGVTSLDHFPWQKVEQLVADKLAQIEAEVARLQRQHQGLSQCATLLAQPLPLWRPRSGTPPTLRIIPPPRIGGKGGLTLSHGTRGVMGLTARSHTMTPNLLVLNGNPKPDSLCHALAREYARSAEQGAPRHPASRGGLAFAPDLHHGYDEAQPLEPDLQAVQQSLAQAHHLVIVAPVWWGHLPARLKGLLDRTLLPGFAFRYQPGRRTQRLLAGKTARLLLTMDSPLVLPLVAGRPRGAHPGPAGAGAVRHPADPPPASGARPHLG